MRGNAIHIRSLSAEERNPSRGFRVAKTLKATNHDPAIAAAVEAAQGGDRDAFCFLYLRYKDSVYGYLLSILRDRYDAEDVTQHVFLKLMSVIQKYEPGEVPFTSWFLRVARNAALDHLRQRRPIPTELVYDPARSGDDRAPERQQAILTALRALPDDQRGVVAMRHLAGLSPIEIAGQMRRSESSIHALHHRGTRTMRRELLAVDCAPATLRAAA
jgi:RNA polymerase sigma-70 factor, ECF subfamily